MLLKYAESFYFLDWRDKRENSPAQRPQSLLLARSPETAFPLMWHELVLPLLSLESEPTSLLLELHGRRHHSHCLTWLELCS